MKPRLSVLIPSRKRVESLRHCLEALAQLAKRLDLVEFVVGYDSDDSETAAYVESPAWGLVRVKQEPNDHLTHLHNRMAECARGDYLWLVCDDVRVATEGWDAKIIDGMDAYLAGKPDRIAVGDIEDDAAPAANNPDCCCFPVITREAVSAMGFFFDPRIATWGGDIWLCKVFGSIGRVVDLKHVAVKNLTYWNGSAARDEVSLAMETSFHKHRAALDAALADTPKMAARLSAIVGATV